MLLPIIEPPPPPSAPWLCWHAHPPGDCPAAVVREGKEGGEEEGAEGRERRGGEGELEWLQAPVLRWRRGWWGWWWWT